MANRKRKTAIKLMIQHFDRLARVSCEIDENQAYFFNMASDIAELYLKNEQDRISKAYEDGVKDLAIGSFYEKGKHYFEETYGK